MSVSQIRDNLLAEAAAARDLFTDLAKVELYIGESYRTRSLIELLQNADDAGASRFVVRLANDVLYVGNDGRAFNEKDIVALCRSGASNKERGGGTIGYRGIGFKSVVAVASLVAVTSGEYRFRFSRELTKAALQIDQSVPLIRIPHVLAASDPIAQAADRFMGRDALTTVFAFSGLDHRIISAELADFDLTSMLFLNAVRSIAIDLGSVVRHYSRQSVPYGGGSVESILSSFGESSPWLVLSKDDSCEKVALSFVERRIRPAPREQSVIHAFMPTLQSSGASIKLNGDFSTDPSRKSIDWDNASNTALARCVRLIGDAAIAAIQDERFPGIFGVFPSGDVGSYSVELLRSHLAAHIEERGPKLGGADVKVVRDVLLPPDWLPYPDYESLCKSAPHIPAGLLSVHPELTDFFRWLGANSLSLDQAIALVRYRAISTIGYGELFCRIARQFRFDLNEQRLTLLRQTPLIPIGQKVVSPEDVQSGQEWDTEFVKHLLSQGEVDDVRYMLKRLGLSLELERVQEAPADQVMPVTQTLERTETVSELPQGLFRTRPAITRWRSAEKNAQSWLEALRGVIVVKDVSQANLGYDLELLTSAGELYFVEVKAVTHLGDPVRLTNNEHATAYQLGSSYLIAFVVNDSDDFEIRFVGDPVRKLACEKRCEQWSWYFENYTDSLVSHIGDSR